MSKVIYNKQRHLELLKLKYKQKKVLDSIEKSELNKYSVVLETILDWEVREQYLDLLENFSSGKISAFQFYLEFTERNRLNDEVFDCLTANFFLLSHHQKAEKFSDFIFEIMNMCYSYSEVFESSSLPKEKRDLSYLEFRNHIKKIYLEIQNFLNEE